MSDIDVDELARTLERAIAAHERLVVTEAQKRAGKLAVEYAKAADERIKENATDLQRQKDLVQELKWQRSPLLCRSEGYALLEKRIKEIAQTARQSGNTMLSDLLLETIADADAAQRAEYERQQKEKAGSVNPKGATS